VNAGAIENDPGQGLATLGQSFAWRTDYTNRPIASYAGRHRAQAKRLFL